MTSGLLKKESVLETLTNPKRIAFAIVGIIQQSIVSMKGLTLFMGVDAALHFYLVITMIIKQNSNVSASIITSFIQIPVSTFTHVTVLCIMLGFFAAIFVAMLTVEVGTHSLGTLNSMQGVKRVLTAFFLGLMTCLQLPIMEIILSIAFIDFGL